MLSVIIFFAILPNVLCVAFDILRILVKLGYDAYNHLMFNLILITIFIYSLVYLNLVFTIIFVFIYPIYLLVKNKIHANK